jgi:hypothetical protein
MYPCDCKSAEAGAGTGDGNQLLGLHDLSLLIALPWKPFDARNKLFLHVGYGALADGAVRKCRASVRLCMDGFDFLAIPTVNKTLVLELARCEFLARRVNVLLLGNSDPGKTHIALALGLAAAAEIEKGLNIPVEAVVLTPDDLMAQVASGGIKMPAYVDANYGASILEWMRQTYERRLNFVKVTTVVESLTGNKPQTLETWVRANREAVLSAAS